MRDEAIAVLDGIKRIGRPCCCGDVYYPAKVRASVNGFERCITFRPGYICPQSGGNSHGRHGMEMLFMLKGDKGGRPVRPVHRMAAELG